MQFNWLIALCVALSTTSAQAQVPVEWDQWIEAGVAAEDNSKYGDAEELFSQACDVSLAEALGSERITRACLMLSRTYAVQGRWRRAADAAETLVEALDRLAGVRPKDQTETLIKAAEVDMARGDFKGAATSLHRAIELTRQLDVEDAASAYVDLSTFYMGGRGQEFAGNLLAAARHSLASFPNKESPVYVRTAAKVGRALEAIDRWSEAVALLHPLVEAAERRLDVQPDFDDLWREYEFAAMIEIRALRSAGQEQEADRIEEWSDGWPREYGGPDDEFTDPKLAHRVRPQYTMGAKTRGVSGTVTLSVVIGTDGRVHDIDVLRPLPYGLTWESVRAVRQWRYRPARVNGEPIPTRTQINVVFILNGR